jgi:hypothetical protein
VLRRHPYYAHVWLYALISRLLDYSIGQRETGKQREEHWVVPRPTTGHSSKLPSKLPPKTITLLCSGFRLGSFLGLCQIVCRAQVLWTGIYEISYT